MPPEWGSGDMIAIEYLGRVRGIVGKDSDMIEVGSAGRPLEDVVADLRQLHAEQADALQLRWLRFAINGEFVGPDALARPGDKLAIFTAVSGG
jgi:molybdopterin converting factor small subunit